MSHELFLLINSRIIIAWAVHLDSRFFFYIFVWLVFSIFFLFLLNFIEFWKPIFLLMSLSFLFWHFRKMARFLNAKLFHISTPLYMLDWLFRNFYLLTSKITTFYSSQYHNIYEKSKIYTIINNVFLILGISDCIFSSVSNDATILFKTKTHFYYTSFNKVL